MSFPNLKNFLRNIPSKYILLVIVFLGFILRVNNLTIGFPILFVSNDEAVYHQSALNMLANKTPFTIGNYGPLGAYFQIPFLLLAFVVMFITGKVNSVGEMELLLVTQEGYLLFIPRIISAMFGTLSILVAYLLAKELFNLRKIALWASFFFAVSFNLVHISHQARAWAPSIFFCLLAVLFAVKSTGFTKNQLKNTLLSYFFSAVSFGFHQMSGLVFILIILIRIFYSRDNKKLLAIYDLVGILLWISAILIFNFLSLGSNFLSVLSPNHPAVGLVLVPPDKNFAELLIYFFSPLKFLRTLYNLIIADGVIVILTALFFLQKLRERLIYPFLIYIIFNLLIAVSLFPQFLRYLLPSFFLVPILAAPTLVSIKGKFSKSYLLILLIVVAALFNSIYWNLLILREPTFIQVRKWLDQNISAEVPVAYSASRYFGYTPAFDAGEIVRRNKANYYLRSARLIGQKYHPNVRNILYTNHLEGSTKKEGLEKGIAIYPVNIVIDSYLMPSDRLLTSLDQEKFKLVVHFSPTGGKLYNDSIPQPLVDPAFHFPLFRVERVGPYFDVLATGQLE